MNKLVETYCDIDDFCQLFIPHWQRILLENGDIKRNRACRLSPAEVMTIIIPSITLPRFQELLSALCLSPAQALFS